MQPKFTQSNLWSFWKKAFAFALVLTCLTKLSYSQVDLFNEGFETVVPAGWAEHNASNPVGPDPTWSQGVDAANGGWDAHSGPSDSWAHADFDNIDENAPGTISNWLFTPTVLLTNGDVFSFWTRTVDAPSFADRLQVRLSTNGASIDVGATDVSVGDFSTLLLDINPTYDPAAYPNVWTLETITISGLAAPVQGRIALRYFVEDGGFSGSNSDNIGIDDAIYHQTVSPSCTTPTPGNTLSSATTACPGTPFNLSVENPSSGLGISFQWQSASSLAGPYTDIAGATNSTLTQTLTATTYYQLVTTCSGTPVASTPVQVLLTPPSGCYCIPDPSDCTLDDRIINVNFGGIDNTSDCSPTGYTNYGALPPGIAQAGAPNPMSVTVGPGGTEYVGVWIDYNHNGQWEPSEYTALGSANGATVTGVINIPVSALPGITGMRVRDRFNTLQPAENSCTTIIFGETEDYNVDIQPCVVGGITTQPTDASANCDGTATFTVGTTGTAFTYQWQERTSATGIWTNVVDGGSYSGATTATLTLSPVSGDMTGYQYRVLATGGCTAADFSDVVTLTVNPLTVNVSPTAVDVCISNATVIPLQITTVHGTTATQTFSSGPVNVTIPDADVNGIISTIPVSLPAGAVVTAASVKLNITHSYVGDLVIALKAPNDNILNLAYALTQTGGPGSTTTGFINTIISSVGVNNLVTGTDPYADIFAPDAPLNPGTLPTTPTALSATNANVFDFSGLYSVPSGDWTLGADDFAGGDEGILVDWELTLTYTIGAPYTGTWSPAEGLFSDAAGTIPYVAGTATDVVYTLPTTTTAYTVTPVTAVCTGTPVTIPINVENPLAGTLSQPADVTICGNESASFTVTIGSGNDIAYQWQESTDGGTNYFDITDGGVYSGATTNTLTLSNVPSTYNGYKYRAVLNVELCGSSATSAAGTLTVNANPVVTIAAAPYTKLFPGLQTVLKATPADLASYQWYLNGVAIDGATSSSLQVDVDGLGDYTVTALSSSNCPSISTATVTISDSLTTNLYIYPNPTTGAFQVRYNGGVTNQLAKPRILTVFDARGSRVFSQSFTATAPFQRMDVDLSKQPKGVYIVNLTDYRGTPIQSERVVIH